MPNEPFKTIRYFLASDLKKIENVSDEAKELISNSSNDDNFAVLMTINSPLKIEKAVNITKEGFGKVRELVAQ